MKRRGQDLYIKAEVTSSNPGKNFPEAAREKLHGGLSVSTAVPRSLIQVQVNLEAAGQKSLGVPSTEVTSSNPGASTSTGCRTETSWSSIH
jgi:hypothetical protein